MDQKDKEILEKIINKNERVLFEFYQKNKKTLFNFIFSQINNKEDAEEILQDTFLGFLESLRDFRNQCSLKTFLFSIAKRKIIDKIRKKKIRKILFSKLPKYLVNNLAPVFFEEELEKEELKRKIEKVFQKLPDDYQLVLRLKYIEGKRVKNIAQKLSMKFKATESLIFRARKAFVKIFNRLP